VRRLCDKVAPSLSVAARVDGLLENAPPPTRYLERLLLPVGDAAELVAVDRIDRIESDRNYLQVFVDGAPRRLRGTLDAMHARLHPSRFLRVNRSTIVQLDAIREVQPWPEGEKRLLLRDGARVTWTRRYLEQLPPGMLL